jgi:hypothetical protein
MSPMMGAPTVAGPVPFVASSLRQATSLGRPPSSPNVCQTVVRHPDGSYFMDQGVKDAAGVEHVHLHRYTAAGVHESTMRLTGAGHGTVFDLEVWPDGRTFVWLSWARDASGRVVNDLVRFPYTPGAVWDRSNPNIVGYNKLGGGYLNVMFDWRHDLVAVRDSWSGVDNYTLRWASDFKEGRNDPLAHIRLPQGPPSMQGFCTANRYLYRLTGTSNGSDPRLLTRYDWRTGEASPVSMEGAGPAVDGFMEPEGVSLHRDPVTGAPSLLVGMVTGRPARRKWNVWELPI